MPIFKCFLPLENLTPGTDDMRRPNHAIREHVVHCENLHVCSVVIYLMTDSVHRRVPSYFACRAWNIQQLLQLGEEKFEPTGQTSNSGNQLQSLVSLSTVQIFSKNHMYTVQNLPQNGHPCSKHDKYFKTKLEHATLRLCSNSKLI